MDCAPEMIGLATTRKDTLGSLMDKWDYIIVGAGSAGCVLAKPEGFANDVVIAPSQQTVWRGRGSGQPYFQKA